MQSRGEADQQQQIEEERNYENENAYSLEDVVFATVLAVRDDTKFNVVEIKSLIPEFNGNNDVEAWFKRVKLVMQTYGVKESLVVLVMVGKLDGVAKQWFHSRAVRASFDFIQWKQKMVQMFKCKDRLSLLRRFEARKWKE